MIEFLKERLANSDGFVLDIWFNHGSSMLRTGLMKVDEVGLVVDTGSYIRCVPWSSVKYMTFEEC